jgi:hypothetical protein
VTVRAQLDSGSLSPFQARVPPQSTWILSTAGQTRIPKDDPYTAVIEARGGQGVVVGRIVAVPGAIPVPQAGLANAVDALTARTRSHRWVVPAPGSPSDPAVAGAAPIRLVVTNLTARRERYVIDVMTPAGFVAVSTGEIAPRTTFAAPNSVLARAGRNPVIVQTGGTAAVSEDVGPRGAFGAVTMPGIALARSLG